MREADQEKTSFITSQGLFYFKVMPFGLKNASATYQRLMNKMFAQQIGRNVQIYIDDMLVRSSGRSQRNIQHPSLLQHEAQSRKMCLWSDGGKIPRIYGVPKGN